MVASTFDALEAVRTLEAAGRERRQAEAIAEQLRFAAGAGRDRLATKGDLDQVHTATKADIDQLRTATKADFDQLRAEMKAAIANGVDRMLFAQLAVVGLLFAALKLF